MAVSLSEVFAGPAVALLAAMFQGMVTKVVVIPGKFFRGCGLCVLWVLSLVSVLCGFGFMSLGSYFVHVLGRSF